MNAALLVRSRKSRGRNMNALKNVEEAARLLGISPWTVRAYIRDGRLRPVRLGRRVLLEETELERFIASSRGGLPNASASLGGDANRAGDLRQ